MRKKPKVAFICVHNSCRSQMAEALGKHLAADVFESYSAGTEIKDRINPTAVRIIKEKYGIDMEKTQYNKTMDELPKLDMMVTMGCGVACPYIPGVEIEDWGLDDPSGQADEKYLEVIEKIEEKILDLKKSLEG